MRKWIIFFSAIALAVTAQSISVAASDTEWDRTVLPRPPQPFEGVTKRTLEGSVASFTQPVKAPADAPNILLVLIDDAGFGNPSTFGGPVATPTFDKLAAGGLRYNRFHVTALCSPTRAALLSGRNHHAVGFGSIAEMPGGWPGLQHELADQRRINRQDSSGSTATTPLQSANGILHPTLNRDQPGLSIAGRTRSDSIISGDFSAAKPASSIRC